MIFEILNEAVERGELLLVEGGLCHFHRRQDGTVTIREILVLPANRRRGIGRALVTRATQGARLALAKCPADLADGNAFWLGLGFELAWVDKGRPGRPVNVYHRLPPCV